MRLLAWTNSIGSNLSQKRHSFTCSLQPNRTRETHTYTGTLSNLPQNRHPSVCQNRHSWTCSSTGLVKRTPTQALYKHSHTSTSLNHTQPYVRTRTQRTPGSHLGDGTCTSMYPPRPLVMLRLVQFPLHWPQVRYRQLRKERHVPRIVVGNAVDH